MRKVAGVVVLGTIVLAMLPAPAAAGGGRDALLAFGAFTLFTQILMTPFLIRPIYAAPPPVVYSSPPAVVASAGPVYASAPVTASAPSAPRVLVEREVVVHPHGRYVLRGDGVTVAYQWIWVPSPPAGAPPPPPR